MRHGESQGNADDHIYETTPDHSLTMTDRGREQVRSMAPALREVLLGGSVRVWASPYARTLETFELLDLGVARDAVRMEPRLREQDWGNFQIHKDVAREKQLRDKYGHFYYRFIHGESGTDVYDRVSAFLETLHRNFTDPAMEDNAILITHGLTMRLFCMRWFYWSVEYFESLQNPPNASFMVLEKQPDRRYRLTKPFNQWDTSVVPNAHERASWL